MFNSLAMPAPDALHGVMARYAADKRIDKIDLGVGIYYNRQGISPVMQAIQLAEAHNIAEQRSKSYLGLRGLPSFLTEMQTLAFTGSGLNNSDRISSIQSVGGTGGVRLAIELAAKANRALRVHVGTPTWPSHFTICEILGVESVAFPYFDQASQELLFDQVCESMLQVNSGDVVILHGPCHNPSGQDLSDDQFTHLISLIADAGAIPLIDAAYYGLGADLEQDLARIGNTLADVPNALLVLSCSKAFGLYRERVGVLFVINENIESRKLTQATLERMARGNYSMPPAHGANAVARVLATPDLKQSWHDELIDMRQRINDSRSELVSLSKGNPALAAVANQQGIFSLLPVGKRIVKEMADSHAIYMPDSARINLAGFKTGDAERFVECLEACMN